MGINYGSWPKGKLIKRIRELEGLVFVDPLTGLGNRRAFEKALEREVARVKRGMGEPLSVAIIDVDHFKSVNDTYGHDVGDRVLEKLGGILRRKLRPTDFVGRQGGEEFVILMPKTNTAGARTYAERVRVLVATLLSVESTEGSQGLVSATVSIGVATWDKATESPDEFLKRADQALYAAKAHGRNRVVVVP
jgi:diguanylate cyclase (GGDEF)-like protein